MELDSTSKKTNKNANFMFYHNSSMQSTVRYFFQQEVIQFYKSEHYF